MSTSESETVREALPARRRVLGRPRLWELILSGSMAGILLISFAFPPDGLPALPMCQFKTATGRPCPGCGLTRAFSAISHGRLREAAAFNPFGFPLYALTVFFLFFPLLCRLRPGTGAAMARWRVHLWLPIGMLGALWAWGIWRLLAGD